MANRGFIKGYIAGAAIVGARFLKFGADEHTVIQATAPTDMIIGVSDTAAVAAGDPVDVVMSDMPEVEYGAPVAVGKPLTTDAEGRAVEASADEFAAGFACRAGILGDQDGEVFLTRFKA